MLDTNIVSHLIKGNSSVARRIVTAPITSLCISAITEGELLFGLAKRPEAKQLHRAVREFLRRVDVLPWDSSIAEQYGTTRAHMELRGTILAPLDLLIGIHALSVDATLVTNDQAFSRISGLRLEDWTN
jgi:tRNA(fMet)-specific endonuclease VapC